MKEISLTCVNPECEKPIQFATPLLGTVQSCVHWGQSVRVKFERQTPLKEHRSTEKIEISTRKVKTPYMKETRGQKYRTRKKVKAFSGCLAAFVVMMGALVVTLGLWLGGDLPRAAIGKIFALAGLASIAAFAYFGYVAVESDDHESENRRMRQDL